MTLHCFKIEYIVVQIKPAIFGDYSKITNLEETFFVFVFIA